MQEDIEAITYDYSKIGIIQVEDAKVKSNSWVW